jgi:dephospho-CoA kinase
MLTIGLTGPSGAGKGTVASLFARYGIPSIDTDAVYHALLIPPSPCLDELVERFGREILTEDGTLHRPALAARVFAKGHENDLQDLNRITHFHVLSEARRRLSDYAAEGKTAVLVDAPQLYESGFDSECDHVLAVLAPRELRMSRIMERDGLDAVRASARLDAQKPDEFFRAHADAVLYNGGEPEAMTAEVEALLRRWEVLV